MRTWICTVLVLLLNHGLLISSTEEHSCCPKDYYLQANGCVSSSQSRSESIKLKCPTSMYMLDPHVDEQEQFYVDNDGILRLPNNSWGGETGSFCVAELVRENITESTSRSFVKHSVALVCFPDEEPASNLGQTMTVTLTLISVVFLILTFLVYIVAPELRDLQGKCTMCACACLCLGFLHLAAAQWISDINSPICQSTAFGIYFWIIAAFVWMNNISINVMRSIVYHNSTVLDNRMFIYYSIYGWGVPLILLLCTFVSHHSDGSHMKPGFGDASCWFSGKVETWSYFYIPMAIFIAINIILFLYTSIALCRMNSYENARMFKSLEYKFYLYIKLFLVTGISWIFEIISFMHENKSVIWLYTDAFNALQGVVFFLVLVVFRKRALRGLASRGVPMPCNMKNMNEIDEEYDDIIKDEEVPAMITARP